MSTEQPSRAPDDASAADDADDAEAMRRCARGDIAGLDDLVARHQLAAIRFAYLLVGDSAAAEDIVQDSFLGVFRAAPQFRPGARFAPWLHRIVLNGARQYLRASRRRRETSLEALVHVQPIPRPPVASDPLHAAERSEQRHAVAAVLATLTHKQREVLVLRYYGGYHDAEIASLLGVPGGTVRWRLHTALRAFERSARRAYPWLLDDVHPGRRGHPVPVERVERIAAAHPTTEGRGMP